MDGRDGVGERAAGRAGDSRRSKQRRGRVGGGQRRGTADVGVGARCCVSSRGRWRGMNASTTCPGSLPASHLHATPSPQHLVVQSIREAVCWADEAGAGGRRLNNAKQDMINRTLYALTLVTAIATPVTICTGIYGMNFDDMPELVSRQYGGLAGREDGEG
eukprot:3884290-Rhodomonas_salina.1